MSDEKKKPAPHKKPSEKKDSEGVEIKGKGAIIAPRGLIGGGGLLDLISGLVGGMDDESPCDSGDGDTPCEACGGSGVASIDSPFDVLEDDDFDSADPAVDFFKKDLGGVKGVIKITRIDGGKKSKEGLEAMAAAIASVRTANRLMALREVFASANAIKRGAADMATQQISAASKLQRLAFDALDTKEREMLLKARAGILSGDEVAADTAAYRVQQVFASHVQVPSIRVAFLENGRQQQGEAYQQCPKALHQIGQVIPMPLSTCRAQCIDSRTDRAGRTACAYSHWLKVAADTQAAVDARMDVTKHPDNDLITLAAGQRSHREHDAKDVDGIETRLDQAKKNNTNHNDEDGTEKLLEDVKLYGHQDTDKQGKGKGLEDRLRKPLTANCKIDPDKKDTLGKQIEEGADGEVAEEGVDARLEDDKLYGRKGEPKESYPTSLHTKSAAKIDPKKDDTLGKQIAQDHDDNDGYDDHTLEAMLLDEHSSLSDDELDELGKTLEELLEAERKEAK